MADFSAAEAASDPVGGLFEPDVVLPTQFFDLNGGIGGGERKLMAALLADGIESYISACTGRCAEDEDSKREAFEWVETKDTAYIFSFDSVCASLGVDADYLRIGLSRYVNALRTAREGGAVSVTPWKKIRRPRK